MQVGAVKLRGLSQLMLLAAAAAEVQPRPGASLSAGGAAAGVEGGAGALPARQPAAKHSKPPAGKVLGAVAWMPEKVR